MLALRFRLAAAAVMVLAAGAGLGAAVPIPAGTHPVPGGEGPAGRPALLPGGRVARPPVVSGPLVATACPAAPYGPSYYAPGSGKTVALTFDDGPGASTAQIRKILHDRRVTATFFNIGQNTVARPGQVHAEAAAGYLLGNHTWDHPNLTRLSTARQAAEMDRATAAQRNLTGASPCLFRPPGGSYNATTLRLARQRRMRVWLWSADTEDWKAGRSASRYWVNRIVRLAEQQGGTQQHPVILLHNQPAGNPATVRALPRIIAFFRSHHYRFVDLLGRT